MNTEFNKFLKSKLHSDSEVEALLSNIKDINNLTVSDLVMISNKLNESYSRIINMYCNEGYYYYTNLNLDTMVEYRDVNGLRRLILDGALILKEDAAYLRYRPNEISSQAIKPSVYQAILKILLEANEVKLAQMISNRYLVYDDLSLNTTNVVDYLYDEYTSCPISYVFHNYSKIPVETRLKFESKMVDTYLEAIDIIHSNTGVKMIYNSFLEFDFVNGELSYKLNPLYLEFNDDNRDIILNKIKGIN